jgi:small subunit ribosomal protein S17
MAETVNPTETKRGNRKERVGEVVSNKMTKTIVVRVERRFPHAQYKKIVTAYKKFYAHDEKAEAKIGDTVRIEETRPLSKLKRWKLVEVVERNAKEAIAV